MTACFRLHILWLAALLAACGNNEEPTPPAASPAPTTGTYVPIDDVAKRWGTFDFYGPHATLAGFQGHLSLEAVGTMPATAGKEFAGSTVYRIVNADELHEQNANRDYRCLLPAKWLAIKPASEQGTQRIQVLLLMMDDWKFFEPVKPGFCGSGTYEAG
jgi:hypothetical protein